MSRANGVVEYQFEGAIRVESRGDEGLVTCRMEDNHSDNKPRKSLYLYVAGKYLVIKSQKTTKNGSQLFNFCLTSII